MCVCSPGWYGRAASARELTVRRQEKIMYYFDPNATLWYEALRQPSPLVLCHSIFITSSFRSGMP